MGGFIGISVGEAEGGIGALVLEGVAIWAASVGEASDKAVGSGFIGTSFVGVALGAATAGGA